MAMSSFTVISATVDNERDGSTLIGRRNSEQVPEYHNYHSNHINLNDEGTDVITINVAGKRFEVRGICELKNTFTPFFSVQTILL